MSQIELPILAPKKARRMVEPIVREAKIEDGYRWSMKRAWGAGPCVHWNLLNPSDADAKRDDPTTLRMMLFSSSWGFGSMIVTNIYPFISSTTDKLAAWRKTFDHKTYEGSGMRSYPVDAGSWAAFHTNIDSISEAARLSTTSVAAWGSGVDTADLEQVLKGARIPIDNCEFDIGAPIEWKCLGRNSDGSPRHPLSRGRHRIPDDQKLQPWGVVK